MDLVPRVLGSWEGSDTKFWGLGRDPILRGIGHWEGSDPEGFRVL